MKKIIWITLFSIIIWGLAGCHSDNVVTDNETKVTENNLIESKDNGVETQELKNDELEIENPLTPEEEMMEAAKDNAVTSIISAYKWDEGTTRTELYFNELIERLEKISSNNIFAKEFVAKAKNTGYYDLDEVTQLAFDIYVKLLFRENSREVETAPLGDVEKLWYGYLEGSKYDISYLGICFTNYPGKKADGDNWYIRFSRNESLGEVTKTDSGTVFQEGETFYLTMGIYGYVVEDIGAENLNEFILSNQEFIDFLIDYRDNVYVPIRNEKLAEEKEQKEQDKKLSEKIPQIGMTKEEVKKTKWGSPDKVNKDTYSWGTKEQWVYDKKGYVYFENGVVTSVSER